MTQMVDSVNGVHRLSNKARAELIRSVMRTLGSSVTMGDINRELLRRGQESVSQYAFRHNYEKVFTGGPASPLINSTNKDVVEIEPQPLNDTYIVPPAVQTTVAGTMVGGMRLSQPDKLERIVKFICAVEALGGPSLARRYLDAWEAMDKIDSLIE